MKVASATFSCFVSLAAMNCVQQATSALGSQSFPPTTRDCSCTAMKKATCIGTGHQFGKLANVDTPENCCTHCKGAQGCVAWTWAPPASIETDDPYNCWLKDNQQHDPDHCEPNRVSGGCGHSPPPSPSPSPLPTSVPVAMNIKTDADPVRTLPPTYMGVTLDWWPPGGGASGGWGNAGLLNIDLQDARLRKLTRALRPGTIRVGGGLDKSVKYLVGDMTPAQCGEQGGNGLCLNMTRWAEFVDFMRYTGSSLTWGLSYPVVSGTKLVWNKTNPQAFLEHVGKNATQASVLNGIELGEEIDPRSYDSDFESYMESFDVFKQVRDQAFKSDRTGVPGSYGPCPGQPSFDHAPYFWFPALNRTARDGTIDVVVFHSYNDPPTWPMLLNNTLQQAVDLVGWVQEIDTAVGLPSPRPVVLGEGGPHNGGGIDGVTNTYASSIYYLDALGVLAKVGVVGFNRQTLVGGHYELLNTSNFEPFPDYWVGFGYNRLVGPNVLHATTTDGGAQLQGGPLNGTFRAYAHCAAAGGDGVMSAGPGDVVVFWASASTLDTIRLTVRAGADVTSADLYALSPSGGDLYSPVVELNGKPLQLGPNDELPPWVPSSVAPGPDGSVSIAVPPMGTGWAVLRGAGATACT